VRSLFGDVGCDRLKLRWLCAIAVWGCGVRSLKIRVVCDHCLGMLGERSFKIGVVRSLFGDVGGRSFKIRGVGSDRCLGMLGAIV